MTADGTLADDALTLPEPVRLHASDEAAATPFLKWVGGKRALCETIARYLPDDMSGRVYREPFLGGGAMFFWLHANRPAKSYVISDFNERLASAYSVVRSHCDELRNHLVMMERGREHHGAEAHYYLIRDLFNSNPPNRIVRAAALIYLNRTGFNGLYRTSQKGVYNVPFGRYAVPPRINDERIERASRALASAHIYADDFAATLRDVRAGDVVYLDPPYVPASKTANFAAYAGAFGLPEQQRLADVFRDISKRGAWAVLSNSDVPLVRELYAGFRIVEVEARRSVAASGESRKPAREVLVLSEAVTC